MNAPVFVDTNVLLYARDTSEPAKQPKAAAWLEFLWRERLGRTSVQVLSEYYQNATRKLKPGLPADEAWDDVRALMAWRPEPVDEELLRLGREVEARYRIGWWDSLVVAAAQRQGCALLLTEDLQHGMRFGGVEVIDPFSTEVGEPRPDSRQKPAGRARASTRRHPPKQGSSE